MDWFKFYGQDFLTDSKLGALNPLQRLMWVAILCIASQDDERTGIIKFLTEDRIKELCGITDNPYNDDWARTNETLVTFCNMGLVTIPDKHTIIITNFNKKQLQQTTSTERVAAWRLRNKAKKSKNKSVINETNVTLQSNGRVEKRREEKSRVDNYSPEFISFWNIYPRKIRKGTAYKAWEKISKENIAKIMEALPSHIKQEQWIKNNGEFIPYPATWLNGCGWEDEIKKAEGAKYKMIIPKKPT